MTNCNTIPEQHDAHMAVAINGLAMDIAKLRRMKKRAWRAGNFNLAYGLDLEAKKQLSRLRAVDADAARVWRDVRDSLEDDFERAANRLRAMAETVPGGSAWVALTLGADALQAAFR